MTAVAALFLGTAEPVAGRVRPPGGGLLPAGPPAGPAGGTAEERDQEPQRGGWQAANRVPADQGIISVAESGDWDMDPTFHFDADPVAAIFFSHVLKALFF